MRKVFCLLLGLWCSVTFAQQRIPVQEGIEVHGVVSINALNRIAVENDRILTIKGTQGEFELDKDGELGQIFLKPLKEKEEPIHVFIITENGHTYSLGLSSQELGAESIVLVPINDSIAAKWEQSSAYESLLKSIIQAMHGQSHLDGFLIENAKVKLPKIQGASVVQLQSYSGHQLLGQVLEVSNTTTETLHLMEPEFYGEGVRAISIVNKTLPPKGKTRVYWVR